MKKKYSYSFLLFLFLLSSFGCKQKTDETLVYPETVKGDHVDVYFGHEVPDPYRWLEDDNSPATKAWVEAQNEVTNEYLSQIPFRDLLKKRLSEVWAYARQSSPKAKGGNIFYFRHDGIIEHAVYYVKTVDDENERVLIDPNLFSEDGTTSLAASSVSHDGKFVAYAISKGGSDWREVFIRDVETGKDLPDHLKWVKFSGLSWDKSGFYYSRYDEPVEGSELSASNENQKVFYHKLGTSQSSDVLVYHDSEFPRHNYSLEVDDEMEYAILFSRQTSQGNSVMLKDLQRNGNWQMADNDFTTTSSYVGTIGNRLLMLTNNEAARYRLVAVDPRRSQSENWEEVIPETGNVLRSVFITDNYIVTHYIEDVQSQLKVFNKKGGFLYTVDLPESVSVSGIEPVKREDQLYFSYTSYTTPERIVKYDLAGQKAEDFFIPTVDFDHDAYETKLVFMKADDGAQVPLFIVHKKGLVMDGNNPALLYGYGGFNVVKAPAFDVRLVPWLENGGVYVSAHIRGGGEYGDGWYRGGILKNKQRVFDDFIHAAEYLIENGITGSDKLAIMGGSNGGLLVGAVANQRPDLFRVALPAVGVMDMLRYQYFTIGWAWAGDYGRSDDSEEMFGYLHAYSPLHNIPEGIQFPATLVTTADHDDRVVPAHSFKYIATLQEKYIGSNPVLIRIETKAGHGAGKPVSMQIDEVADKLSFALFNMGLNYGSK